MTAISPHDDWTFDGVRDKLRAATKIVLDAEAAYEKAINHSADAEAVYRKELATAYQTHRAGGAAVAEAETLSRGDVVLHSRERDYAAGMVRLAADKLEDARDSRRSLWRLVEWARERDLIAARAQAQAANTDERVPSALWP